MTYLFIWIGYFLLKSSNTDEKKIWGFALVMAALPLSRLLAVIGHGGNEITAMRMIFASDQPFKGIPVIVGGILVLSLLIAPLWRAYRSIRNKHSWLIFLAFLVVPWQIDELIITKLLNGYVVSSGFLMHPIYLGTPLLVIVWQIILIVLFLITKKQIQCFLVGKCS
jgi:hypothetical protein